MLMTLASAAAAFLLATVAAGQICPGDPNHLSYYSGSTAFYNHDCDPAGSQLDALMLFEPPSVPYNYTNLCVALLNEAGETIPGKLIMYEVNETPSTASSFEPKASAKYELPIDIQPEEYSNVWQSFALPGWVVTKPRVFIGISWKSCNWTYIEFHGQDVGTLSGRRLWYIRANSGYDWEAQTDLAWERRWSMLLRAEGEALPAGWVPEEWTCAEDDYKDGSVCNCECGTFDPDCLNSALSANCSDDQACTSEGTCIDLDWEAAGLCTAADYGTRNGCQCCGPSGQYDLDCYDYSQYTYCSEGVPGACNASDLCTPKWDCPLDKWNDGVCDCGCNPPDIDCLNSPNPNDCSTGECDPFFGCFDSDYACNLQYYGIEDGCDCDCGALDPDCKITNQTLWYCSGFSACSSSGSCAVATCGNDWVDSLFQGDPDLGEEEECDGGTGCTACKCDEGFYPFEPVRQLSCFTVCNDSIVAGAEQCDGGAFCTDCMCDPQHDAYHPPRLYCSGCGNSFVDPGEECDGTPNCTSACLCESGLVSFNGNCSALLPSSSSSSLSDQTTPSSSTTDPLVPSSSSGKKPKSLVGPIVGGILGGIAGLAVAGALVFVGVSVLRKRQKEQAHSELASPHGVEMQAASSSIATTGGSSGSSTSPSTSARHPVVLPLAATAAVATQAFDPVAAGAKLVSDEGRWRLSEKKLTFGLNGEQASIGVKLTQTFELLNERKKKVSFQAIGRECNQYSLVIAPPSGVVKGMYGMSLTTELTLHCSAVVNTPIPIVLTFKRGDKELKEYRMLDVEVQGKLSTRIDLDEIEIQGVVGEGSFGVVSRGTWRGNEVAVKELKRTLFENEPSAVTDFIREVEMLEQLRAPQIITFFGAVFVPDHICLVTEFCPLGSLERVLRHYNTSLLLRLHFAIDCSKGMNFLHKSRILHRDLKLDNLLVVSLNVESPVLCKISDFGTSRGVAGKADMHLTRGLGTPVASFHFITFFFHILFFCSLTRNNNQQICGVSRFLFHSFIFIFSHDLLLQCRHGARDHDRRGNLHCNSGCLQLWRHAVAALHMQAAVRRRALCAQLGRREVCHGRTPHDNSRGLPSKVPRSHRNVLGPESRAEAVVRAGSRCARRACSRSTCKRPRRNKQAPQSNGEMRARDRKDGPSAASRTDCCCIARHSGNCRARNANSPWFSHCRAWWRTTQSKQRRKHRLQLL